MAKAKKTKSIRLKKKDLDRALVRVLSRSAWEKKSSGSVREQVHRNPKRRPPRHKESLVNQEE